MQFLCFNVCQKINNSSIEFVSSNRNKFEILMKRVTLIILLIHISQFQYGQIIADHTVVDKYDDIPQYYIDKVKQMWLTVPGESHSAAYRTGLEFLEALDPKYQVNVTNSGTPEASTTSHLRTSRGTWGDYSNATGWIYNYGEEDWFTNPTSIARTKAGIAYCNTNNLAISAIGFGWCYDMYGNYYSDTYDPVYHTRWWGVSLGTTEGGTKGWGLNADDYSITGNAVSMDTYLNVTQQYIDYCASNGYSTKVFFTTGPVDHYQTTEDGYQGYLKFEHIRDYVAADATRILFDYADILCYDDGSSTPNTATYTYGGNNYVFPWGTATNIGNQAYGHISSAGSIRLAKAMWWMLARIAGWDGGTTAINDHENRANSLFTVEATDFEIKIKLDDTFLPVIVRLFNLKGNLIAQQRMNSNLITLQISHLPAGIYFVVVSNTAATETRKIVIS